MITYTQLKTVLREVDYQRGLVVNIILYDSCNKTSVTKE